MRQALDARLGQASTSAPPTIEAMESLATEGSPGIRFPEAAEYLPRYYIFIVTWVTSKTFNQWLTGRGFIFLRLDPVYQAPMSDHLSDLIHVLGTSP